MAELSNITSDYGVVKQQLIDEMNQNSSAFQALYPSSTANLLASQLAGISALWNHKIEQAALNLFMSSAYGRQTVYALAKTKGYTPANKIPAVCNAVLDISNIHTDVSIPSGTSFIIGDYKYHTDTAYSALSSDNQLIIHLIQGELKSYSSTTTGTAFDYFEFSEDFKLTEGTVNAYINSVAWINHGTSFFGAEATDKVYITSNNSNGKTTLTLGNGSYGMIPPSNSSILITWYENVGSLANSNTVGLTVSGENVALYGTTSSTIYGGKDEEDTDSIKYTATKLAYTDDDTILITRKNFAGYLYRQFNVLDGRAWGAYEETLRTDPDVTQMNNIWYTVVPPDCTPTVAQIGTGTGTSTATGTLTRVPVLPGSVVVTVGGLKFSEPSGGYGILCEDETTAEISGGTPYANHGASSINNAFDSDLNSYFDAGFTPTELNPVIVGYTFSASTNLKALRIRSIATQDSTKIASPKSMKIMVTTQETPDFTTDDNWSVVDYFGELGLILSNTWSRWIGINTESDITAVKLVITSSTTEDLKIAEIQMQNSSMVSTVNYTTGNVSLKSYTTIPAEEITGSFVLDSIPPTYIEEISQDLSERSLFTTQFNYKTPNVRTIDIYCNVFYSSAYDGSSVKNEVTTNLNKLFVTPTKMLGSIISLSDIYYTIMNTNGVTRVDIISPTSNAIMYTGEFPVLNSLTLNMDIYNV